MTPNDIIDQLGLEPHPEGGWYSQTWAAEAAPGGRATATAIYFLLKAGERSHWHKVDATEIWLYHAGAPLTLEIAYADQGPKEAHVLGPEVPRMSPQIIVPPNAWQQARSQGDWEPRELRRLAGFLFSGFTLAPDGFDIPA